MLPTFSSDSSSGCPAATAMLGVPNCIVLSTRMVICRRGWTGGGVLDGLLHALAKAAEAARLMASKKDRGRFIPAIVRRVCRLRVLHLSQLCRGSAGQSCQTMPICV